MAQPEPGKRIRSICRAIVNNKFFDIAIFVLILLSVGTIIVELVLFPHDFDGKNYTWIHWINDFFFYVFALELTIRLISLGNTRQFLREFWLDIIAIIPMFPGLRFLRVFRLLRLLRIMSLMVLFRRHMRTFNYFFRKNIIEYLVLFVVILFITIIATLSLVHFDHPDLRGNPIGTIIEDFWMITYSLFSGQYSNEIPPTVGGKIVFIVIMFCNMSLFAILTGTVSSIMVARLREGTLLGKLNFHDLENHVIICGWNDQVPRILAEMQKNSDYRNRNYIIVAEIPELPDMSIKGVDMTGVYLVNRDFTSADTLRFVNIQSAAVAIILSDMTKERTTHDTDARTVLAALTIEKLNPGIHTCAELIHSENEPHLAMTHVESIVLTRRISALMLTQAAMKECVLPFYSELIHPSEGNTVYEVPFPEEFHGMNFDEVIIPWKKQYQALLVGIMTEDGEVRINPIDHMVKEKDKAVVIAGKKPKISKG